MTLKDINLNKTMFITHCDLDGTIPIVLNRFFQINYSKEIMSNYGEDLEISSLESGQYENVIYVDFAPNEKAREIIKSKNIKCLVIDHHIAAKPEIEQFCENYSNSEYIFDNEKCGTKLYYEWLVNQNGYKGNDVSDKIVELTNTYDLYKQDSSLFDEADKMNRLLYSSCAWYVLKDNPSDRISAYKTFINSMLWKTQNMKEFKFVAWEMEKILKDIQKSNDIFNDLIKNSAKEISTRKDSKGEYFAVFKCNSKISEVANRLLKKFPKLSYCVVINEYDENSPKISLRAKSGFDLLKLNYVKGHSEAAGVDAESVNIKEFAEKLKKREIFEFGYKD